MPVTCGVLFLREDKILLGHVTGQEQWDIPKGKLEGSETPEEAACRECKEEANISITPDQLIDLGEHSYRRGKPIHLFMYKGEGPTAKSCRESIPKLTSNEFDNFTYADYTDIEAFTKPRLRKAIFKALLKKVQAND